MSDDVRPAGNAPEPPARSAVPSWRLVLTLTLAGALSAAALSVAYEVTLPAIEANKARVLASAVREVLKGATRVESLRVLPDGLEREEQTRYEVRSGPPDRVFRGFDDAGRPLGFALVGEAFGYGSDPIRLIFGYDAATGEILGLAILDQKETPGIGTKIEDDPAFVGPFWRSDAPGAPPARRPPLVGTADDRFDAAKPEHVDMISGATISSRAVIKIVNDVVGAVGAKLEAYVRGEGG